MDMMNSSTHEAALRNNHSSNDTVQEKERYLEERTYDELVPGGRRHHVHTPQTTSRFRQSAESVLR